LKIDHRVQITNNSVLRQRKQNVCWSQWKMLFQQIN